MGQLLVLGGIVTALAVAYMYISGNKEKYVKKEGTPKRRADVIYLPPGLGAQNDAHENVVDELTQEESVSEESK